MLGECWRLSRPDERAAYRCRPKICAEAIRVYFEARYREAVASQARPSFTPRHTWRPRRRRRRAPVDTSPWCPNFARGMSRVAGVRWRTAALPLSRSNTPSYRWHEQRLALKKTKRGLQRRYTALPTPYAFVYFVSIVIVTICWFSPARAGELR